MRDRPPIFVEGAARAAILKLNKHQLIDILADMLGASVEPTDQREMVARFDSIARVVLKKRNDKPCNLLRIYDEQCGLREARSVRKSAQQLRDESGFKEGEILRLHAAAPGE